MPVRSALSTSISNCSSRSSMSPVFLSVFKCVLLAVTYLSAGV